MKNIYRTVLSLSTFALLSCLFVIGAKAALVPTFLIGVGNGSSQVQVTVIGADPNAPVTLHYPVNGSYTTLSLPATDSTGRLSYLVSSSINPAPTAGGLAYVTVDGAQSQTQTWPTVTGSSVPSSSGLALSQNYITITQGQSVSITASGGSGNLGLLSVPANTNPSVVYVSAISGSQITVSGSAPGSATLTVCAANVSCTSLYATVQAPSSSSSNTQTSGNSAAISLSPSSFTISVGQSETVTLSGPGSYYISSNSNPSTVSYSMNGSILTVKGLTGGNDNISICGSSGNTTSCSTLVVTVTSSANTSSTSQGTISFSLNEVDLNIGQSRDVTITGSVIGMFYISANSNPNAVTAVINNNTVTLKGYNAGSSNITICQIGGACADVYGFVPVSGTSGTTIVPTATTNAPLTLSSFNISSNNVGNTFMGAGAALTFTYGFNQAVSSQSLSLGGQVVSSYGTGSGPYTAIYTLTGNEGAPITVSLSYSNANGASGLFKFTFGPGSNSGSASGSSTSGGGQTFVSYLEVGSIGAEVTALQTRLTALGVYSGPITGKFGAQTEAAVKKYQAKHGLTQLGAVGPATRNLLNQGI